MHSLGKVCIRDFLPSWIKLHPVWLPLPCMLLDTIASLGQIYRAQAQKGILGKESTGSGDVCNKILEKELLKRFGLLWLWECDAYLFRAVHGDRRLSPKKCLWLALKLDFNFETQPFWGREMMPDRNLSTGASDASQGIPPLSLRHYWQASSWSYKCCPVQFD